MPAAACMCWKELTSCDAGVSWHETQKRNADPGSDDLAYCRRRKRYNSQSVCLYVCSFSIYVCPSACPSHYQLVYKFIEMPLCLGIWRSYNVYVHVCMLYASMNVTGDDYKRFWKDSCMKQRHLWDISTYHMDETSHLTAFCAWK